MSCFGSYESALHTSASRTHCCERRARYIARNFEGSRPCLPTASRRHRRFVSAHFGRRQTVPSVNCKPGHIRPLRPGEQTRWNHSQRIRPDDRFHRSRLNDQTDRDHHKSCCRCWRSRHGLRLSTCLCRNRSSHDSLPNTEMADSSPTRQTLQIHHTSRNRCRIPSPTTASSTCQNPSPMCRAAHTIHSRPRVCNQNRCHKPPFHHRPLPCPDTRACNLHKLDPASNHTPGRK